MLWQDFRMAHDPPALRHGSSPPPVNGLTGKYPNSRLRRRRILGDHLNVVLRGLLIYSGIFIATTRKYKIR